MIITYKIPDDEYKIIRASGDPFFGDRVVKAAISREREGLWVMNDPAEDNINQALENVFDEWVT